MATKPKTTAVESSYLDCADYMSAEVLACVREHGIYLGVCIMQASGAWTRMGPTWHIPAHGWVCVGPGMATWGTTHGLAELATSTAPSPKLHAAACTIAPVPNLIFAVQAAVIAKYKLGGLDESAKTIGGA
jgi:hypothetical protein